jgi:hypothetical protein
MRLLFVILVMGSAMSPSQLALARDKNHQQYSLKPMSKKDFNRLTNPNGGMADHPQVKSGAILVDPVLIKPKHEKPLLALPQPQGRGQVPAPKEKVDPVMWSGDKAKPVMEVYPSDNINSEVQAQKPAINSNGTTRLPASLGNAAGGGAISQPAQ